MKSRMDLAMKLESLKHDTFWSYFQEEIMQSIATRRCSAGLGPTCSGGASQVGVEAQREEK